MASTYRQQFLGLLATNERSMAAMFSDLHARIMLHITRAAVGEGQTIPAQDSQAVRDRISAEVLSTFVTNGQGGAPSAFTVLRGRVMPQSPYLRALWPLLEQSVKLAVEEQGAIMRRQLRRAPDVLAVFEKATHNPLVWARAVHEQTVPRRAFLAYDPLHRFVDPRGYRLSDRIWDTATITRRKVDQLLTEMIAEGRGSRAISDELEAFLQPGRMIVRTNKPYGTTASYDAMRLARTEIAAAHSRAGVMSAQMNPFVQKYHVRISGSHVKVDICDDAADGGPYELNDTENLPPLHAHCLCTTMWVLVENSQVVLDEFRDDIRAREADLIAVLRGEPDRAPSLMDFITPLLTERFTRLLLDDPEYQEEWY